MSKAPRPWEIPLVFLVLCILAFGLLIPVLGFYWDDWPLIATYKLQGIQAFREFFANHRPFAAWTYIIPFPILGTKPIHWHIYNLFVRWLNIVAFWWCLLGLWPDKRRLIFLMSLLFGIYPVFTQQPISVTFSQQICYGIFLFSLGLMVRSVHSPERRMLYTSLGILMAALHLFTVEYFAGIELVRPLFLWVSLSKIYPRKRQRLRLTLIYWFPYLLLLMGMVIWRIFFFNIQGEDPNRPELLYSYLTHPGDATLRLIQIAAQDTIYNLFGGWYATINPAVVDFKSNSFLFSSMVGVLSAIAVILFLKNRFFENEKEQNKQPWLSQALSIGFLASLLGPMPIWLTDRQVTSGMYSGRFALAAMFGLSILVVAIVEWLTIKRFPQIVLIGFLIGSAVGFHIRNGTVYYRAWQKQNQFYWQFSWRAPYLEPGTSILSADEILPYVGRYSTGVAINLLYPQQVDANHLAYWFFELDHDIPDNFVTRLDEGWPLKDQVRHLKFEGSSLNSIVIFYKPDSGRCLWVLTPNDFDNPDIPPLTIAALPVSNLSRIQEKPFSDDYPPIDIIGKEPQHTWCYYYQKADLARQTGNWEKVIALGTEAIQKGFAPNNPHELLPFIEAYAYLEQWEIAMEKTLAAYEMDSRYAARLCSLWADISSRMDIPVEALQELSVIQQKLQCALGQ